MDPSPTANKFIYCNSHYPLYFSQPSKADLRHFHFYFKRLVKIYYRRILSGANEPHHHNCIVGCGLTMGELALLILRLETKTKNQ